MLTNAYRVIVFSLLVTSISACSSRINRVINKLDITLIDSTSHSAQSVSVQMTKAHDKYLGFVAGEGKTTEVYAINSQGKLEFLQQYQITNKFGGIRALTHVKTDDLDLLLLGNKADNALETYRITEDGALKKLAAVYDSDSTFIDEIVTIHSVTINNRTFVYAGGLDKGLSCFELSSDGNLQHIQSIEDQESLFLHGIIGMSSMLIEEQYFLITGAFFDGGISCFQVSENGRLQNVSNVKDDQTLFLNGTFPVNSVQIGQQNFLLVGHRHNLHYSTADAEQQYHGDGVNVFTIDSQGQIALHSLLSDTEDLKLKGSTRIEIIKLDDNNALVFIGTRDDQGIQICSLKQDGTLHPIKAIDLGYPIYNGMAIEKINNIWYLMTGAYDKNRLELYSIIYD